MTYRRLTKEELAPLEKKFIQFLVANTITGDDWAKMKLRHPQQADGLIDIFSDLMFYESMKKVQYLLQTSPKQLNIYHCGETEIELLGLSVAQNSAIDFSKDNEWLLALKNSNEKVDIIRTKKTYSETREVEIFKMIEHGSRITDSFLYDALQKLFYLNNQN